MSIKKDDRGSLREDSILVPCQGSEFSGVELTDGDCERVRGVIGLGYCREVQQNFYHILDLPLVCTSIAGDGTLHLGRAELADGEFRTRRSQCKYTAGLGDGDACGDVAREIEFLDSHYVRLVFLKKRLHPFEDERETVGEWGLGGGRYYPVRNVEQAASLTLHNPETRGRGTRIDAENLHWTIRSIDRASLIHDGRKVIIRNVEIGINVLHVFVILQRFNQSQYGFRSTALHLSHVLWNHG